MSAPYRSWPKTRELKKIRDTQATLRWRNRTSPIYLGFTRPIRSQEGRITSLLYRLPEIERRYREGLVSHPSNGRIYRFARTSQGLHNPGCLFGILATSNQTGGSPQDRLLL